MIVHRLALIAGLGLGTLAVGAPAPEAAGPAGDPVRGRLAIESHGCVACHQVPGIPNPGSSVGPALERLGQRIYLAGVIPNTPDNMVRWLRDPPAIDPRTLMPNTGLSETEARDIAAYLYQAN